MKLLHAPKFVFAEEWDNDQFISNIKMLELELKRKSAKISIEITEEFQGIINKKSKGVCVSMIIKPHGVFGGPNQKKTTRAITIRYPQKSREKFYIYSNNANKFIQIIPKIINVLDKEIQRKLVENLKNNHSKRLYQVKVEEWVKTVEKFDGDVISSNTAKIDKIIISKHDETQIIPTTFDVKIPNVNKTTLKKIIKSIKKPKNPSKPKKMKNIK